MDDLVVATYVLAGFSAALVAVTMVYALYTRQQVKLLRREHELTKRQIAVEAQIAWATSPSGYANEQRLDEVMKELGLDKL